MYVLATSHKADFKLPEDDEVHPEWRNESMSDLIPRKELANCFLVISFLPQIYQSSVKLLSPKSGSVIDRYTLASP
jgi:cleavage and polyadenylation specificity factor subunit 1